ncbi:hypothetical protein DVH24_021400 [Malus domestica]|uniref:Uncharacterized protein n=1 Tax=Malus domestica TaxID=3750 RepID=A0A498JUQ6_MALDO|nr:hypothetical protein DVH24_021400 [Malus domestica]
MVCHELLSLGCRFSGVCSWPWSEAWRWLLILVRRDVVCGATLAESTCTAAVLVVAAAAMAENASAPYSLSSLLEDVGQLEVPTLEIHISYHVELVGAHPWRGAKRGPTQTHGGTGMCLGSDTMWNFSGRQADNPLQQH